MALKAIIENLETVEEGVRALYRKVDAQGDPLAGKYVLDVEAVDGYVLAPVENLRSALSSERALREKAENLAKAFEGVDPTEAKTLKADLDRLRAIDPKKEADKLAAEKVEAYKVAAQKEFAEKEAASKAREARLADNIRKLLVNAVATQAISKHEGNAKLLLPHIEPKVRVKETEAGEFVAEVLNDQGVARIKDASGALMTIEDLVVEMRGSADYGLLFKSTGTSGGGAQGGGGKAPSGDNPWATKSWNVTKQMQLMISDPAAADRLKREAGVTA